MISMSPFSSRLFPLLASVGGDVGRVKKGGINRNPHSRQKSGYNCVYPWLFRRGEREGPVAEDKGLRGQ